MLTDRTLSAVAESASLFFIEYLCVDFSSFSHRNRTDGGRNVGSCRENRLRVAEGDEEPKIFFSGRGQSHRFPHPLECQLHGNAKSNSRILKLSRRSKAARACPPIPWRIGTASGATMPPLNSPRCHSKTNPLSKSATATARDRSRSVARVASLCHAHAPRQEIVIAQVTILATA
jgi:hypothetical protein